MQLDISLMSFLASSSSQSASDIKKRWALGSGWVEHRRKKGRGRWKGEKRESGEITGKWEGSTCRRTCRCFGNLRSGVFFFLLLLCSFGPRGKNRDKGRGHDRRLVFWYSIQRITSTVRVGHRGWGVVGASRDHSYGEA